MMGNAEGSVAAIREVACQQCPSASDNCRTTGVHKRMTRRVKKRLLVIQECVLGALTRRTQDDASESARGSKRQPPSVPTRPSRADEPRQRAARRISDELRRRATER